MTKTNDYPWSISIQVATEYNKQIDVLFEHKDTSICICLSRKQVQELANDLILFLKETYK